YSRPKKVISMRTFAQNPCVTPQNHSANQSRSRRSDPAHARGQRTAALQAKVEPGRCACGGGCPTCVSPHATAKFGTSGAGGPLPYAERIQRSFGRHDVSGVVAHTGSAAATAAHAMGASAFTAGEHVAFAGHPNLHTAAHEAA